VSGDPAHRGAVPVGEGVDGVAEVAQHVPAVGDLDGPGRALASTVGVRAGTVAGDDLDSRVRPQPSRERGGLPVWQEVDDAVAFEVDEHRAVAMAAAPCVVIDAQNARGWGRRRRTGPGAYGPEQRVRTGGDGQSPREPCAGLAAQRGAEAAVQAVEPLGAARGGGSDAGQALGEGQPLAGRNQAAEPACADAQYDGAPLPRQIMEAALVEAVDGRRRMAAPRAGRGGRARLGGDRDTVGRGQDLHNGQARRDQGQQTLGQRARSGSEGVPGMCSSRAITPRPAREVTLLAKSVNGLGADQS
jgi:hypothetical protein